MQNLKRLFLIILALLSCRAALAQDYILDCFHSDDNVDRMQFVYNADNLLESCHSISNAGGEIDDLIDSLYYDERGNVIRIDFFQYYENEWIFPSYVTYTYDDNNHRLTRTNYNDWGSGFELQGIYTYYYDDDLLTSYEMTLGGMLLMRGTYTYDANGLLLQCLYDASGNCTNEESSYWENGWVPNSSIERVFDDNGNCLQRVKHSDGMIVDRVRYNYDEACTIDNVIMPYHPEPNYKWEQFAHRPISYAWETVNDGSQLTYVCDYIFEYKTFEGIPQNDIPASDMMTVYPNPTQDEITLSLEGLRRYEIIGMNGQTVMQGQTNGKSHTINVSHLASGLYLVKAYNGQNWSISKMQIK